MQLLFSCSNALVKWLKLDFPRIPSPDGKKVGTQTIVTDANTMAWQCHVIQNFYHRGGYTEYTVIAVEAHSRYTILMPYEIAPTQDELANELVRQWGNQSLHLMQEHGVLSESHLPQVAQQFMRMPKDYCWYKNTDMSVNGHVSDAEQWVRDAFEQFGLENLNDDTAFGVGLHINERWKRAKIAGQKQQFFPIPRFIDDALSRFATVHEVKTRQQKSSINDSNVVSLNDYRKER